MDGSDDSGSESEIKDSNGIDGNAQAGQADGRARFGSALVDSTVRSHDNNFHLSLSLSLILVSIFRMSTSGKHGPARVLFCMEKRIVLPSRE